MKKLLPYIVILIVLAGLFSSVIKVNAEKVSITPYQDCLNKGGKETVCQSLPGAIVPPKPPTQSVPPGALTTPATPFVVPPATPPKTDTTYTFLAPLPCDSQTDAGCVDGKLTTFDPTGKNKIGGYLNLMIKIFIALCAVLAVIMIVMGGIEYMTSELISSKEAGKERITGAVFGLVLALGAWTLLNTINPDILNTELSSLKDVTVEVNLEDLGGEGSGPVTPINKTVLQARGIACDENPAGGKADTVTIGQQFVGKTTYSMPARSTSNTSTLFFDCSSFVAQVYRCAGLSSPGSTTATIFSGGNTTAVTGKTYDFTKLNPGDLVGWKAGDNKNLKGKELNGEKNGHVMIYIGNGQVLHTTTTPPGGTIISSLNSFKDRITYVKWP